MSQVHVVVIATILSGCMVLAGAGCRQKLPAEPTQPVVAPGPVVEVPSSQGLPVVELDSPLSELKANKNMFKQRINSVAFSPDGKTLAAGGEQTDGAAIKIWDIGTNQVARQLPEKSGFVLSVMFHPDGRKLASTSYFDAIVRLWDTEKPGEPTKLEAPFGEEGASATYQDAYRKTQYRGQIKSVSFHPQGKLLATAGPGRLVRIWDIEAQKLVITLPVQSGPITSVAFSPDGKTLATGICAQKSMEEPGALKLWDTATWQETANLPGIKSAVESITFHPKGTILAWSEHLGKMEMWDIAKQQLLPALPYPTDGMKCLTFSPDGSMMACVSKKGTAQFMALEKPQEIRRVKHLAVVTVAFSPDSKTLATSGADEAVCLWKVKD
jgi:WD40 repeat protein